MKSVRFIIRLKGHSLHIDGLLLHVVFIVYGKSRQSRCLPIVHQTRRLFVSPRGLARGGTNTTTGEDDEGYQVAHNLSSSNSKSSAAMEGQQKWSF